MIFDLSDEQKMLKSSLEACLGSRHDAMSQLQAYDEEPGLNRQLWQQFCDLGLPGILPPEAQGGLDMGLLTLAIVAETLGHYSAATPLIEHCLVTQAIARYGNEQQQALLAPLIEGRQIATIAWGEPDNRWDVSELETGTDVAQCTKVAVPFSAEADLFLVALAQGQLALLDRQDTALIACNTLDRSRPLSELRFEGVALSPLEAEQGYPDDLCDALLILHAADAFGAASYCLEMALEYARERKQFGRPIGSFQAVKHQLANMALQLEPCRYLYWYAAHAWNDMPEQRQHISALAKAHITDAANEVCRAAVEIHGGIGYTWEYPLHISLKRAMFDFSYLGTPGHHRARQAELASW